MISDSGVNLCFYPWVSEHLHYCQSELSCKDLRAWRERRVGLPTGFLRQTFPPSPRGPGSGPAPLMGSALRHTVENTPLWELIPKRRKGRTESSFLSYSSQVYKFTKSRLLPGKRDHEESPSFQKAKGREQRPCSLYSPSLLFSESSGFTVKPLVKQDCDGPEGCDQGEMSRVRAFKTVRSENTEASQHVCPPTV